MVADAFRRNDHRHAPAGAVAGVGAPTAIGVMEWFSLESPQAEPTQPRALVGGTLSTGP